jgi:hypothetical protein
MSAESHRSPGPNITIVPCVFRCKPSTELLFRKRYTGVALDNVRVKTDA